MESKIHTHAFFSSLPLCTSVPSNMKKYVGSRAHLFLENLMAYVSIPIHVYISFLLKPVCTTAVSLDHLCILCMIVLVSLLF